MEFLTGFESTYLPGHDVDVLRLTRHDERWHDDLRLVRDLGVRRLRYPIPWHRIEATRGRYDWAWLDEILGGMRALGLMPIADLVHHTSFPRWLTEGFLDPAFGPTYTAFCAAFAARYPWVREFTVFNEPLPTTLLCTEFGVWPPARRDQAAFYRMALAVARAICTATAAIRAEQPAARFIHVDTAEGHGALDSESEEFARHLNQRRFLFHDLILGRVDADHPLWPRLREHGGMTGDDRRWFRDHAARIDVLGLDYYAHCEHQFHRHGSICPSRAPQGFAALARQYHERYGLPIMLTETNIRGYVSDRISWLKYMVEECEALVAGEIPFEGFCWFPCIDSTDWDSLLRRPDGHIDPVGLYVLEEGGLARQSSELPRLYRGLAGGELVAADLPAYRFLTPVSAQLEGWEPRLRDWPWQRPALDAVPRWAWPEVFGEVEEAYAGRVLPGGAIG
ncbi:MAG: GH1 [uncultured Thermomicrobiales bacterium]|uniref:GH1 n=1 Tax=uncultured Thermomicrobiales bacterium TaxID=1645740 RepID=A0A6J4VF81_9BACT|nr:MAG: GH1 [uncultured Thermomicrobiales bacterium]